MNAKGTKEEKSDKKEKWFKRPHFLRIMPLFLYYIENKIVIKMMPSWTILKWMRFCWFLNFAFYVFGNYKLIWMESERIEMIWCAFLMIRRMWPFYWIEKEMNVDFAVIKLLSYCSWRSSDNKMKLTIS